MENHEKKSENLSVLKKCQILPPKFVRVAPPRAGAGGYQNYQPGYQKKNLGAKRQKNRSRKNAFAEFLPGGQKFGAGVGKNGNFLRFSLEKNSYLK